VRVTAVAERLVEARRLRLVDAERAVAVVEQFVGARFDGGHELVAVLVVGDRV
jgi:hypothetical protein